MDLNSTPDQSLYNAGHPTLQSLAVRPNTVSISLLKDCSYTNTYSPRQWSTLHVHDLLTQTVVHPSCTQSTHPGSGPPFMYTIYSPRQWSTLHVHNLLTQAVVHPSCTQSTHPGSGPPFMYMIYSPRQWSTLHVHDLLTQAVVHPS